MFEERPITKNGLHREIVCGIGVNDADYQVTLCDSQGKRVICPYYQVWRSMLKRCYCPIFLRKQPTYVGCSVDSAWHLFSVFKTWMQSQDWENKVLDKDLSSQGNKHYSAETCLFVSQALNNLLCLHNKNRGNLPLGVSYANRGKKQVLIAQCSFYGKKKHLGYFSSVEAAAEAYKQAKLGYIAELAVAESNPLVKQALLRLF